MSKNYFFFALFTVLCLCGMNVQAQENSESDPYELKGRLLDIENEQPIPFAHITNLKSGLGVLSDSSGLFRIPASQGDSLLVSSVSYGKQKVVVPAEPAAGNRLLIRLAPNVYQLEEVVVNRFPSERRFKDQLLSMELPEDKHKPNTNFPEYQPRASSDGTASVSLGSPISAIASQFSKKERGRAFKAKMVERDARKAIIHTKFNREIVKEITGLEDEEQLDAFMKYCVLSEDFLYRSNEYEIHKAVLGCFKDFVGEQG